MSKYHEPVLLNESVDGLNIDSKGVYVDVTFGGGGHSKLILDQLDGGRLFAFDQDKSVNANILSHSSFKLINANFRYLKNFLKIEGVVKIDGLLASLIFFISLKKEANWAENMAPRYLLIFPKLMHLKEGLHF